MAGSVTSMAILAGGASRRMGEDKALLRLTADGLTLLERAILVASGVSSDVFVVCPPDREYARFGARIAADRFPGEGPLGGIITALEAARADQVLVLSCDHPFLSVPLLRWISELPAVQLVLPEIVRDGEKRTFPVHARYKRDTFRVLMRQFAAGERRLGRAISALETRLIGVRELQRFDPGLRSLINVNTPEEARAAGMPGTSRQ